MIRRRSVVAATRTLAIAVSIATLMLGSPTIASAEKNAPIADSIVHADMPPVLPSDDALVLPAPPDVNTLDPITAPIDENTSKTDVAITGDPIPLSARHRHKASTLRRSSDGSGLAGMLQSLAAATGFDSLIPEVLAGGCSGTQLPQAPVLSSPSNNAFIEAATPVLKITNIPCDPNGDAVVVNYHVSKSGGSQTWSSGWTADTSVPIAPGNVFDGQQYTWYVESADVCGLNPLNLCNHSGQNWNQSSNWNFTISQRHLGTDKRYTMWKQKLGNGMRLRVNQSNGNLFLKVPVGHIATIAGKMRWGLSYNSESSADKGLGAGWRLYAGSESGGGLIPVELKDPADSSGTYKMTFENGDPHYFTKVAGQLFLDGEGGKLKKNPSDNSFVYTSASGDTYNFNPNFQLAKSKNAVSKDLGTTGIGTDFTYTFDSNDHLTRVDGPTSGQHVYFNWTNNRLQSICETSGCDASARNWSVDYTNGIISSIWIQDNDTNANPLKEAFTSQQFGGSNSPWLLNKVQDGRQLAAGLDGWKLEYTLDSNVPTPVWRVSKVSLPGMSMGAGGQYWYFNYTDFSSGNSNLGPSTSVYSTELTDPRGTTGNNPPFPNSNYTTYTYFNYAGLPVQQDGPAVARLNGTTYTPERTWLWDNNSNIRCERDPIANNVAKACFVQTNGNNNLDNSGDGLSTIYTHSDTAPYPLTKVIYPQPKVNANGNGTGTAKEIDYTYDGGSDFQGLWSEQFSTRYATGVPDYEGMWSDFNYSGQLSNINNRQSGYAVRFTGTLHINNQDKYFFKFTTSGNGSNNNFKDGVSLSVDGTTLFDCFTNSGGASQAYNCDGTNKSTILSQGDRQIMIAISNPDASNLHINFQWNEGSAGNWQTIQNNKTDPNLAIQTQAVTQPVGNDSTQPKLEVDSVFNDGSGLQTRTDQAMGRRSPWSQESVDQRTAETRTTTYDYFPDSGLLKTKILPAPGNGGNARPQYDYHYAYVGGLPQDASSNPACLTRLTEKDANDSNAPQLVTTNACNARGNVTSTNEQIPAVTDGSGTIQTGYNKKVFMTYGALGTKLSQSLPVVWALNGSEPTQATAATTYTYNADLSLNSKNTPPGGAGNTTTYFYTPQGWLDHETLPAGGNGETWGSPTASFTYDNAGNQISRTDARGKPWNYTYDSLDRQVSVSDPTGVVTNTYYMRNEPATGDSGLTTVVLNSNGVATSARDDMNGHVASVATYQATKVSGVWQIDTGQAPTQGPTTTGYDIAGDVTSVTVPGVRNPDGTSGSQANITETMSYDAYGEMTQDDKPTPPSPSGSCTSNCTVAYTYAYNRLGELYRQISPRTSTDGFDPLPNGTTDATVYTYDLFGNVASVAQTGIDVPNNNPATFTFYSDAAGNRVEARSPLACNLNNGQCTFGYSGVKFASAAQETRTWIYYPGGAAGQPCNNATGNSAGLLACSSVGSKITTFSYADSSNLQIGEPSSVTDARGITVDMSYDNYGNQVSQQKHNDPSTAITSTYDQLANPTSQTSSQGTIGAEYDAAGRICDTAAGSPDGTCYNGSPATSYG